MRAPAIYREGHAKARAIDRGLADAYIAHTMIGDPPADAAIAAIAGFGPKRRSQLFEAMVMEREEELRDAPREVRDFVSVVTSPAPADARLDPELASAGSRCYYKHPDLFLLGVIIHGTLESLTTTIARSFVATGYTTQHGVKRLRQNLIHLMESMLPGSLNRKGDGWRLTIRTRLMHAQVRRNLLATEDWDPDTYGVPVNPAHVVYSMTCYSARVLRSVERLGFTAAGKEREGYVHLWRHIGWLMGVPSTLLFANEAEAWDLWRVGGVCEPPPNVDSILMTHTIVNALGLVLGLQNDDERRRKMAQRGYRIARVLIGSELVDQLEFPKTHTFGLVAAMRWARRLRLALRRGSPQARAEKFMFLLNLSGELKPRFDFELPDLRNA